MKRLLALLCLSAILLSCTGCLKKDDASAAPQAPAVTEPAPTTEPPRVAMDMVTLAAYAKKATVTVNCESKTSSSLGSGFFIDDQGTLVTNYHVIDGADSITIDTGNGTYDVEEIVDFSVMYDIAVLKADVSGNDYLELSNEPVQTGESVYAVGSPLGLEATFSDGIVSNESRKVGVISCVQTTAAISSGNSGGPLVNVYGEVVGVNAFSYISGENLNLAINIYELDKLSMDKNWTVAQFREWYKKEIDRSYNVYNYVDQKLQLSMINTYQHITGENCIGSAFDWNFLEDFSMVKEGYIDTEGLYFYLYEVEDFDKYTDYLTQNGFVFKESEDYTDGISYFYVNEFTGEMMDLFILQGGEVLVIEPSYGKG